MVTWPQPTRRNHEDFCVIEGWQRVRNARGRTGTHHITYELALPDGRILRTRISHPVDRTDYGANLWKHILRDQLQVSEQEFWICVRDKKAPDRGRPAAPVGALPADLVFLLVSRVGLTDSEVSALTRDEAIERLRQHWTQGA